VKLSFRVDAKRQQRRSDGSFSLEGKRFEVPSVYKSLKVLTVRYARWDLTQVHLVDTRAQNLLCQLYPIDRTKNADGMRRTLQKPANETALFEKIQQSPLLKTLMEEYSSTGLPPAYIPTKNEEEL
jgi:hypothetical protein